MAKQESTIKRYLELNGSLPDNVLDRIGEIVYQAIRDYGLKFTPDDNFENRLIEVLCSYFTDFTLSELKLAFDLPLVGLTNINLDMVHTFSIKLMCAFLKKYRVKRMEKLNKYRDIDLTEYKESPD